MTPRSQATGDAIEGWKAIAEYLGRRVRTVQLWEKELRLPIRRLNKRVFAHPAELDEWRRRNESAVQSYEDPPEQAAEVPPVPAARPRRWTVALRAAFAVVLLAAAGIGATRMLSRRSPPAAYRISGATLIVTGRNDAELWRHTFPDELDPSSYVGARRPANCIFADLDGDGEVETVFSYHALRNHEAQQELFCFSPRGEVRWRIKPGHRIVDWKGQVFEPPYSISAFNVFRPAGSKILRILVVSNHQWSFASQALAIDGPTGKQISEYWHRGHLRKLAVADLDGDGDPALLLGGVNDAPEVAQAEVVIFDNRRIAGSATKAGGEPYFRDLDRGTEKAIIRFPRSEVSRRQEFNIVGGLQAGAGRIVVSVKESTDELGNPCVVYELANDLSVSSTSLCDGFETAYRNVTGLGLAPPRTLADQLRQAVTVIRRAP